MLVSGFVGAGLLSRDDRAGTGFLLGAALGPIGVGIILARRRKWEARWCRELAGILSVEAIAGEAGGRSGGRTAGVTESSMTASSLLPAYDRPQRTC